MATAVCSLAYCCRTLQSSATSHKPQQPLEDVILVEIAWLDIVVVAVMLNQLTPLSEYLVAIGAGVCQRSRSGHSSGILLVVVHLVIVVRQETRSSCAKLLLLLLGHRLVHGDLVETTVLVSDATATCTSGKRR
jgi:hypothetical protein